MTSLILGGTGFIGKYLVDELLASGRKVITVSRNSFTYKDVTHIQVADLFDNKVNDIIASGVDEVIYLAYATKPKTSFDNPVRDIEQNLAQAVHLFEIVALSKRIKKIIYVSSGGTVYGNTSLDVISEDHPKKPISPYGITKLTIEQFAYMFFTIYNLPVIIVRPANAYGIGQVAMEGQGFVAYVMQSVLQKMPVNIYGEHGTVRDYIYVSDVAKGIRSCLDKAQPGSVYNIGSGTGYSNIEVINLLQKQIGSGAIATAYGDARPFDVNKNILGIAAIKKDTGWEPEVSLAEGLKKTWDSLKAGEPIDRVV